MDINNPPTWSDPRGPAMRRWQQDVYNGVKCPNFHARMTTGDMAFAATNTWKLVAFNDIQFNNLNAYTAGTTYQFRPNFPGYYQMGTGMVINCSTSVDLWYTIRVAFFKNGVLWDGLRQEINGLWGVDHYFTHGSLLYLNGTTDYVDVRVKATYASGSFTVEGGDSEAYPFYYGHKITY